MRFPGENGKHAGRDGWDARVEMRPSHEGLGVADEALNDTRRGFRGSRRRADALRARAARRGRRADEGRE